MKRPDEMLEFEQPICTGCGNDRLKTLHTKRPAWGIVEREHFCEECLTVRWVRYLHKSVKDEYKPSFD